MHFKCTNPSWRPPASVQEFVKNVQNQSSMIASLSEDPRRLDESLGGWRIGEAVSSDVLLPGSVLGGGGAVADVPLYTSGGLWRNRLGLSVVGGVGGGEHQQMHTSRMWGNEGPSLLSIREMALNATYLHSVHSNRTEQNRNRSNAQETTPLLSTNR